MQASDWLCYGVGMPEGSGQQIVKAYSRVAFLYGLWTWLTERRSLAAALAHAKIRDGEAVLEVAVGTGQLFEQVLRQNPSGRNVGIDLTAAMLRRARRKADLVGVPCDLVEGDARSLSFPDASFDLVINNNMLGLVAKDEVPTILSEMQRVLRPGGRIVLVMMMKPTALFGRVVYSVGAECLGGWREARLESQLQSAGFEVVGSEVVSQLGIPSEVLEARKLGADPSAV